MEQDHGEDVETVLAQHMLRLFKHHDLTGAQAKSLLEKVRLRLDAGEIGLSNPEHRRGRVSGLEAPSQDMPYDGRVRYGIPQ